ncbi:MAG: hypothetical protein SGILL_001973 [Bacillariaceae sp.]
MNEALQEVNQPPSSSVNAASLALSFEDGAVSRNIADVVTSPRINVTKDEVSAAEAVVAMAGKEVRDAGSYVGPSASSNHRVDGSGSSVSSQNSTGSKRDRSEIESGQAASMASSVSDASAEEQRQKIARLDGHTAPSSSAPMPYEASAQASQQQQSQPQYQHSQQQQLQVLGPKPPSPPAAQAPAESSGSSERPLQPFPYFSYRDFRHMPDPDPLTPLTAPGRVPNFPAKMHSILSRPDLADIISWMPHGRAWRVLKPREFEVRVIPTYFEHAKFSSFIRQANGWGFRRLTQGKDRNAYYHEMFLRGLPHLCKMMKRPGVSEKQAVDPDHEPDFYKIAEESPVPEKAEDDSILLQCTLQGGPKARMPIYFGSGATASNSLSSGGPVTAPVFQNSAMTNHPTAPAPSAPPQVQHQYPQHQTVSTQPVSSVPPSHELYAFPSSSIPHMPDLKIPAGFPSSLSNSSSGGSTPNHSALSYLHAMTPLPLNPEGGSSITASHGSSHTGGHVPDPLKGINIPDPKSSADAQFAAGFAAAAALSQQQFQALLGQALASVPTGQSAGHQSSSSSMSGVSAPAPVAAHAQHPVSAQESHHHHHSAPVPGHYVPGPAQTWKDIVPAPAPVQAAYHVAPQQQQHYQHHQYQQQPPSPPQHHHQYHQAAPQEYSQQPAQQPYHHQHHGAAQPVPPPQIGQAHYGQGHAPAPAYQQQHHAVDHHRPSPQPL